MMVFGLLVVLCGFLFTRMPGSFLPEEDQGYAIALIGLPPGASHHAHQRRARPGARRRCEKQEGFDGIFQVSGFSFVGQGENVGIAFIRLKPWDERKVTATRVHPERQPGAVSASATRRSS